jgi:hypothetical protein
MHIFIIIILKENAELSLSNGNVNNHPIVFVGSISYKRPSFGSNKQKSQYGEIGKVLTN